MPIKLIAIKAKRPVIDTAAVMRELTGALRDMQAEGVRLMATYPPQRADSRYRRTGTLKRSWSMPPVRRQGSALAAEIFSNGGIAPYNRKVQGVAQDPFFGARGWVDVRALVKLVNKQLPVRVQRAMNRAVAKGMGL